MTGRPGPPTHTPWTVVPAQAASPSIRFVADGRAYEPSGSRADEFVTVFGELPEGPAFTPRLVVQFNAQLTGPDGSTTYAQAQLDYPVDTERVHETEYMVLLYGMTRAEVPVGTAITHVGQAQP
jgi:hypothetical protein